MWEVRQRGLDVGLSTEVGHAPDQIWRTAAAHDVDLIVLPESLFGSFRPVVSRSDTFESVQGAPCALLIVEDRTVSPGVDFSRFVDRISGTLINFNDLARSWKSNLKFSKSKNLEHL